MEQKRHLYPKLNRIKHNSYYLGIIQNLYCSNESELVSFLQFEYQKNILQPFGNEYAYVFDNISKQDLFHSGLLAEIIVSLGGNPIYCDNQGKWLSGRRIDFVANIKQMLQLDIELKEKLILDYKTAISKIDDPKICKMLSMIVSDEQNDCDQLKTLLNQSSTILDHSACNQDSATTDNISKAQKQSFENHNFTDCQLSKNNN